MAKKPKPKPRSSHPRQHKFGELIVPKGVRITLAPQEIDSTPSTIDMTHRPRPQETE